MKDVESNHFSVMALAGKIPCIAFSWFKPRCDFGMRQFDKKKNTAFYNPLLNNSIILVISSDRIVSFEVMASIHRSVIKRKGIKLSFESLVLHMLKTLASLLAAQRILSGLKTLAPGMKQHPELRYKAV